MFDLAVIGLVCTMIGIGILSATRPSGMRLGVVMLGLAIITLGTCLRIVGPNGKAVHVRINDRGPYHGNRVLDLSRGAAKATGLYSRGVGVVRYKRVDSAHCKR